MEKQLFNWVKWDQQDTGAFMFYDVTLKAKVGEFEAGTKFDTAYVDYQRGTLEFYRDLPDNKVESVGKFKLGLTVNTWTE